MEFYIPAHHISQIYDEYYCVPFLVYAAVTAVTLCVCILYDDGIIYNRGRKLADSQVILIRVNRQVLKLSSELNTYRMHV